MHLQLIINHGTHVLTTVHLVSPQFDSFVREAIKAYGRKNIQLVRIKTDE